MKKIKYFLFLTIISLMTLSLPVKAETSDSYYNDSYSTLEDNNIVSWESTIENVTSSNNDVSTFSLINTKYITKTKTLYGKNSSGNVVFSLSITAKFSYDGITSKCISCSSSSTTSQGWSTKDLSASKSSNKATASVIFIYSIPLLPSAEYSKSVTIQCTPDGNVF